MRYFGLHDHIIINSYLANMLDIKMASMKIKEMTCLTCASLTKNAIQVRLPTDQS